MVQTVASVLVTVGRVTPGARMLVLNPVVVRLGYLLVTAVGLAWGALLSVGRIEESGGVIVARGCPSWAFGRGGTTVGAVYITRFNVSHDVLEHEAVHRAQWQKYGLALLPLYLAAGPDARGNRFEVEAGLTKGGYR
ncbi:Fe-S oxidoreductase [Marisediminicola senii]|uniref:Fe-S oxidoreductase n=1 Tax=Marisediminicola senii TaxID=2711233 RepID=UPI001F4730DE|nr:Fe-S oxidoreductase [Marisediminicola senii]